MKRNINSIIENMKENITNMFICYNNLSSKNAKENRESIELDIYKNQLSNDQIYLISLRNNALKIFDTCNSMIINNTYKN